MGGENQGNASSIAVDLSGFYESPIMRGRDADGQLRAGFAIQNLGPKISYDDVQGSENFLPTNLRIGVGYDYIMDRYNKISVVGEATKLMVPTRQEPVWLDLDGDGQLSASEIQKAKAIDQQNYNSKGWLSGAFSSFVDAPGGFSEEMQEFTWSLGAEYWYANSFAVRGGYFHMSEEKGAKQFGTIGAGFKYNMMMIDVSYLFSTGLVRNPVDSTLRFSLTLNFGQKYRK